jgi:FAD-dependent oxidoreductase domain-containing protein 1
MMASKLHNPNVVTPLPVKPRKRSIFTIHCRSTDGKTPEGLDAPTVSPLVVDPSGIWFRSEGKEGNFLCGMSPLTPGSPQTAHRERGEMLSNDPDCFCEEDLRSPDHHLFEDYIWESLYQRVPAFGDVKIKSSWAGFYEYNTFDQVRNIRFVCLFVFLF